MSLSRNSGRKSRWKLKPPNQADDGWAMWCEIVAGQARELEIGDLVKQAALFRAERRYLLMSKSTPPP